MDSVALAANLALIGLLVAMFVEAVRERRFSGPALGWALAAAGIVVAADVFLYLVTPASQRLVPAWFYAAATLVVIVRMATVTVVGLAAAERLGLEPLPLLRRPTGPQRPGVGRALGAGAGCGIGIAIYSSVLFLLASPGPPGGGGPVADPPLQGLGYALLLAALAVTVLGEELTFRLGIQNWLAARFGWTGDRYWLAIALSSALWSAGHIGILEPDWVKLAQIFPAGLAFGWLFLRYGFESSVTAHAVLNLIMPWLTPRLLA